MVIRPAEYSPNVIARPEADVMVLPVFAPDGQLPDPCDGVPTATVRVSQVVVPPPTNTNRDSIPRRTSVMSKRSHPPEVDYIGPVVSGWTDAADRERPLPRTAQ